MLVIWEVDPLLMSLGLTGHLQGEDLTKTEIRPCPAVPYFCLWFIKFPEVNSGPSVNSSLFLMSELQYWPNSSPRISCSSCFSCRIHSYCLLSLLYQDVHIGLNKKEVYYPMQQEIHRENDTVSVSLQFSSHQTGDLTCTQAYKCSRFHTQPIIPHVSLAFQATIYSQTSCWQGFTQ